MVLRIAQQLARIVAVYLIFNLVVSVFQRELIYHTSEERPQVPQASHLQGIEKAEIEAADGTRLGAWWWPSASAHTSRALWLGSAAVQERRRQSFGKGYWKLPEGLSVRTEGWRASQKCPPLL